MNRQHQPIWTTLLVALLPSMGYAVQTNDSTTVESIPSLTPDRVITQQDILMTGRTSLWQTLALLAPEVDLADHDRQGDTQDYVPAAMSVRGMSQLALNGVGRRPLIVVDGMRMPTDALRGISMRDVAEVSILADPVSLARWGVEGANGVIAITTRKARMGGPQVAYLADLTWEKAIVGKSMANTSAANAQTNSSVAPTDWMRLPLQTGFSHRHHLDVTGGDRYVGYLFSATMAPTSTGVMKGAGTDRLSLRTFVEYNNKALHLSNDIQFDHHTTDYSSFGSYADLAAIDADQSATDEHGVLRPTVTAGGKAVPNPAYEHSTGSFSQDKYNTLTDRFQATVDLLPSLRWQGSFGFVHHTLRADDYLSPSSARFADSDDARRNGTYHIRRSANTQYEGTTSLRLDRPLRHGPLTAEAGLRYRASTSTGERYGGRGILADRMSYVSFTQSYDTLQMASAQRHRERTLQVYAAVDYLHRHRYGVAATFQLDRSSLLAPAHRTAAYWGGRLYWNLHEETALKSAGLRLLRLSVASGTSGTVPFTDRDFTVHYTHDINPPYIYNYYQTGATLNALPNESLRPVTRWTNTVKIDFAKARLEASLSAYHDRCNRQLIASPLPIGLGFDEQPDNGGRITNTGVELTVADRRSLSDGWQWGYRVALCYNDNQLAGLSDYFMTHHYNLHPEMGWRLDEQTARASVVVHTSYHRWAASIAVKGQVGGWTTDEQTRANTSCHDNRLSVASLQLAYSVPIALRWLRSLDVSLMGENLASWRSSTAMAGWLYPMTRRCTLSVEVAF